MSGLEGLTWDDWINWHSESEVQEIAKAALELLRDRQNVKMEFGVIDPQTGGYPDTEKIALTEDWAKHLIYCDINSFAITEDGHLLLTDDCGNIAYCPEGRFKVVAPD